VSGPVESQVRLDVAEFGELTGTQRTHAEIIYALARHLDAPDVGSPASVARELSARLNELAASAQGEEVSRADTLAADIKDELAPRRRPIASTGA
jgi:hypothetical protein